MTNERTPFPQSRKLKNADGTIAYIWDGKYHRWDGPALIPEGDMKKRKYFLYGLEKTEDQWKEARSQRTGLPYYKNTSMKDKLSDTRN
jgi:hypothetical protein